MEKYIECHNCQNQYDCERTYLGGCTDGKEWEDDKDINVRSKKILANRVYSDTTLKKWSKEDLIEHIRILEHNWSCAEENLNNSVKNSEKIFYEQKAEIERLTRELDYTVSMNEMYIKEVEQNAELQKQVDELKEQAVKDAAKEILAKAPTETNADEMFIHWLRERYGVEVE